MLSQTNTYTCELHGGSKFDARADKMITDNYADVGLFAGPMTTCLTIDEARQLAACLNRAADEAEAITAGNQ